MSNKASYRQIDYYLRPSKNVERKMILEVIKNITKKQNINYSYIGMGSLGFIDFRMFHKELMINDMISIEKKATDADRFEFNKPFKIQMEYNEATIALPNLNLNDKDALVWLDYDGKFNRSMTQDLNHLFSVANPFSIVLMTCRQDLSYYIDEDKGEIKSFKRFEEEFEEYSFADIKPSFFEKANHTNLIYDMMSNLISETLRNRNSGLGNSERLYFKQLFFFTYSDNAPMLTFGGILLTASQLKGFNQKFKIENLDFVRVKDKPYEIIVPILTKKETDFLNKHLPDNLETFMLETNLHKIPAPERKAYYSIYRYMPDFRETSY